MEARAKINLTLEVFGTRADGFHDLRSLVVPVSLADEVTVRPANEVTLRVTEAVAGVAGRIGPAADNLAVRAVQLMQRVSGRTDGVAIDLVKRIPIGSGLGGGSADAAAVLHGLNDLWRLHVPNEELARLAAELGSDVPAQTLGGLTLMEGRGERVTRERTPGPVLHLVLAFPGDFVSTAKVYANVIPQLTNGGQIVDNMRRALSGGDVMAVAAALYNGLSLAAEALCPAIARARAALQAAGALGVSMSGSGSCVFGLARDAADAQRVAKNLVGTGLMALPAHTCPVM